MNIQPQFSAMHFHNEYVDDDDCDDRGEYDDDDDCDDV